MFFGTKFSDIDSRTQEEKTYTLKEHFHSDISQKFTNVLADISQLRNGSDQRSQIESWFDTLRLVMRMYNGETKKDIMGTVKGAGFAVGLDKGSRAVCTSSELLSSTLGKAADDFYIYIHDEEEQFTAKRKGFGKKSYGARGGEPNRKIGFWCFNAGLGMRGIASLKPRSILLTSGTLSPMDSFQAEMGIPFNQKLENPHVIDPKQVMISVLGQGIMKQNFNFSYQNRENQQVFVDLGHSVRRIAEKTPGGVLLFFPSYRLLESCFEIWQNNDLVRQIDKVKPLFREPKDPAQYQLVMDRYYSSIFEEENGGAILMGVCRGRISEGLDFSDNAARCVIIVGIPYP